MGAEIERHHGPPILVAGGVQRNASFPDGNGKMNDRTSPFRGKGGKVWDRR
jgi:hypothetical protein